MQFIYASTEPNISLGQQYCCFSPSLHIAKRDPSTIVLIKHAIISTHLYNRLSRVNQLSTQIHKIMAHWSQFSHMVKIPYARLMLFYLYLSSNSNCKNIDGKNWWSDNSNLTLNHKKKTFLYIFIRPYLSLYILLSSAALLKERSCAFSWQK